MRYVAGLDGGGTKTAVTIADENGSIVHEFAVGALNYNGQDEASVRAALAEICAEIGRALPGGLAACSVICLGAAGISNPVVSGLMTSGLREGGYQGELVLVGDHETALCGAHDGLYGAILIAGTGSIAYGRNRNGDTHRAGGFGHLIDDEGSGYSIGRDLLSAVVRAFDGREDPSIITDLVYERLGIGSVREIVGFVYDKNRNKKEIAAIAPLLSVACENGDRTALRIAQKNAEALAETASAVIEQLGLQNGELALLGSVLTRNRHVREMFVESMSRLQPKLSCIEPKRDASYGAVLLALEKLKDEIG
ncbi:ATPase [Paenibacillus sp. 1011MAR3C5]|uniref:N-acetylglucosamine kinase n=1 Tax=Paenibacillus sp. 1011MAR3C5 TaxID=1675787 RepID=UPI000E6B7A1B|nr:BadF/BadG/BcrA/BcrD ATPase family protein [Paenibacillus sp. 1011MAR3C5]RJE86073.1 ATPase [Paenibacillus sp. 1011MAR3C5]